MLSIIALAASGVFVAAGAVYAAQPDIPTKFLREVALVGPSLGLGTADSRRDVIEPPSSIDPGMALDPPDTGAKMPIVHPPGAPPAHGLVLPR